MEILGEGDMCIFKGCISSKVLCTCAYTATGGDACAVRASPPTTTKLAWYVTLPKKFLTSKF
jgi:hypothetical protein